MLKKKPKLEKDNQNIFLVKVSKLTRSTSFNDINTEMYSLNAIIIIKYVKFAMILFN